MTIAGRTLTLTALGALVSLGFAQDSNVGASLPGQAVADALREFTGADGAFVASGLLKTSFQKENLASILAYPTETVVVLGLTGNQIREAFERSVALYPQPNVGFLQVSGFEIAFRRSAPPNSRLVSVTVNGAKLDPSHVYSVAMPSSLQQGRFGYSNLWDNAKIVRSFDSATLADTLKGNRSLVGSLRWSPQD